MVKPQASKAAMAAGMPPPPSGPSATRLPLRSHTDLIPEASRAANCRTPVEKFEASMRMLGSFPVLAKGPLPSMASTVSRPTEIPNSASPSLTSLLLWTPPPDCSTLASTSGTCLLSISAQPAPVMYHDPPGRAEAMVMNFFWAAGAWEGHRAPARGARRRGERQLPCLLRHDLLLPLRATASLAPAPSAADGRAISHREARPCGARGPPGRGGLVGGAHGRCSPNSIRPARGPRRQGGGD